MIKEIFGEKIGMTQIFDSDARLVSATLIRVKPVCALEEVFYKKGERIKIACFKVPEKRIGKVKKAFLGYFNKIGVPPYRKVREVEAAAGEFEAKKEIGIEIFEVGNIVDVRARSKGKGFQGGMRRHNWRGQPRTHGSTSHRRIGSAGSNTFPGRVLRGLRMPGHMGNKFITVKNLFVLKVDNENQVLFLKGAVPGASNSEVLIRKIK
ncbi:MAG: 50S ribosomal protein L3 [Candidatus Omnitrophota bacterium]